MKKFLPFLASLLVLCMILASCNSASSGNDVGGTPASDGTDTAGTVRVMVSASEGITVLPQAVMDIEPGENAIFTLQFAENYVFASTDAGVFDAETGTLTIPAVTQATMVTVLAEKLEFDTNIKVKYSLNGASASDTTSVPSGTEVALGTMITVTAGDMSKHFTGWSLGTSDKILSTERAYTFRVTPDLVTDSALQLKPNYASLNVYSYNANGGTINKNTVNAKGNKLSVTTVSGDRLTVSLDAKYLERMSCATAFWNDGTFTRDGYVLREYNTKADGSGMTILPGDKFYQVNPDGGECVLYCIWEKADTSVFTYEPYQMALPKGIKAANAPDWKTDGVIITGYNGTAETLVIPEYIDGKPVIAIQKGAIKNQKFTTLYLSRTLQEVQDGAITGCSSMKRLYFPSGIWSMKDEAFDDGTYSKWREFYVYASIAPRYTNAEAGSYALKLSRILASQDRKRIISIAGSSTLQGLSTEYLEALLDHEYVVVNFGTTRTTHGSLYLEAMQNFVHKDDIVIFAPENSIYMMGDTALYWKTIRDMETIYQLFRYVDISEYSDVFDAFCEQNQAYAYKRSPNNYENGATFSGVNMYGDDVKKNKNGYVNSSSTKYIEAYNLTFNNRYKSVNEGQWENAGFQNDYTHDSYWVSIDESPYADQICRVVDLVKKAGAKVYFGFAPSDANAVIQEARSIQWLDAYDKLIKESFTFDGIVGSCKNYIYAHEYFFDCAFHTNNYGRTWRTYYLYSDLCAILGKQVKYQNGDLGTDFDQCLFEKGSDGKVLTEPKYKVNFLN